MMLLVSSVVLVTGVISKATTFFIVSQVMTMIWYCDLIQIMPRSLQARGQCLCVMRDSAWSCPCPARTARWPWPPGLERRSVTFILLYTCNITFQYYRSDCLALGDLLCLRCSWAPDSDQGCQDSHQPRLRQAQPQGLHVCVCDGVSSHSGFGHFILHCFARGGYSQRTLAVKWPGNVTWSAENVHDTTSQMQQGG